MQIQHDTYFTCVSKVIAQPTDLMSLCPEHLVPMRGMYWNMNLPRSGGKLELLNTEFSFPHIYATSNQPQDTELMCIWYSSLLLCQYDQHRDQKHLGAPYKSQSAIMGSQVRSPHLEAGAKADVEKYCLLSGLPPWLAHPAFLCNPGHLLR